MENGSLATSAAAQAAPETRRAPKTISFGARLQKKEWAI
jgi:hypothetical protein